MSRGRSSLIGLGVAAGAVTAGALAERIAVNRMRNQPDPLAGEPFAPLVGRSTTVIASDGVPLHVEEFGPSDAPVTVLFVHGFCLSMNSWYFQHRDLADLGRTIFFDHRAHGRSGASTNAHCTIDQLGDDLYRVLTERVPDGPVVIVGHSMGGMATLALADAHPDLFGDKITGVGLLATSAGDLATVSFGLPVALVHAARRLLPGVTVGVSRYPRFLERGRTRSKDITYVLTRRIGFGSRDAPPSAVAFLESEIDATPLPVILAFLATLLDHDKIAAAAAMVGIPVLLLVGDADIMTPLEHSRTIADVLPDAELVVLPGAGHAVMVEDPEAVNEALRRLVGAAVRGSVPA